MLQEVANSFDLELSTPINSISTWYADNSQDMNSVLDLIFLQAGLEEFNSHKILLDLWSLLDHAPLFITIIIEKSLFRKRDNLSLTTVMRRNISSMSSGISWALWRWLIH